MASKPSSPVDVLDPFSDPRFTHEYATLHSLRYHYLLALPASGHYTRTIFLIHGWPDLSLGWRHQIPHLLALGLRVVVPDMLGFGRTESPPVPPNPQSLYGFRAAADAIAELARQLGAGQIILGGHDWGGAVVYRTVLFHPGLVSNVFAVCTPYTPPSEGGFVPLKDVVEARLPNFRYQLQLGGGEVQKVLNTRENIRQFLQGIYGGRGQNGQTIFSVERGVHFENLGKIGKSPLLSEREMEYYVQEYCRNGMDGNLNWYKTTEVNYEADRVLVEEGRTNIDIPTLFVFATKDQALPEFMSQKMESKIPKLVRRRVEASHWALWEKPAEINQYITEFLVENGAVRPRRNSNL